VANNNKRPKSAAVPPVEPVSRAQRILMYMGGSILGLGIASMIALLIGEATVPTKTFEGSQLWETIAFLPLPAITIGFALLIALLIVTFVKRSRAAAGASK
jgi:hypothetical protein